MIDNKYFLNGIWKVKVTSGPTWFKALNLLKNKKIIDGDKGYNKALGILSLGPKWFRILTLFKNKKNVATTEKIDNILGIKWGEFKVFPDPHYTFTLRYVKGNITDFLFKIDHSTLKGDFFYKKKFIGHFTMKRIIKGV